MLVCRECGATFEQCASFKERHGFSCGCETFYVCPECGEPDLLWASQCEDCGKIVPKEELIDGFCLDCVRGGLSPANCVEYLEKEKLASDFILDLMTDNLLTDEIKSRIEQSMVFAIKTLLIHHKDEILTKMQNYIVRDIDDGIVVSDWLKKKDKVSGND